MTRVYIGLGSNIEEPLAQITQALAELAQLPDTQWLAQSRLYRSKAIGPVQPDYINAVALLDTRLTPLALLDALQALEQHHRRVRLEHWGPRTLDLDILLFGDQVIASERLTVPHPFLTQRSFVLYPLADISPALVLPDGTSLQQHLNACAPEGLQVLGD
ncbi:2-amino-4-hydroxy-6-hydroxymethyldihydropteridine diphosphokinase [Cellvibrio japonicus]|uniref:2-amino-4-hydroxy-6-hydroxymethyldihydropteridine pyrophosphokinase n=1 Tax=Cellvibrio japonicus (strain Ueda107) TaxID=498211 RepID=B3PI48_CELJU|nr:2-amino-4-hydroxy-6-hydroxymethyldihydropteridine diphosphokinase [Cellvibrio japonicus]ACE84017.1 2-amino-4-hydroxy-6-hydroxymethyldihydropteridine pyrophosphokinase [Cellvibrio japonicus Ueda107]QEI11097.1 2-amino-4-hydroxy-6-hydroxymethyldihydropteridine diphosphokinase [Cellvibrio japonicus]QEI14671.1 2-amino-4-hydroxy-6-hydroxymethyldihydropteridine diphosphokinase [Cellvibrio japonicus]QEI18251.1 2-amino-4-hydroxy-6-hydroxymethyldihydropteridine diphosphokinase [Cellvibrio japonicus]